MWLNWLLIAGGGACGSLARYFVGGWAQRLTTPAFPFGTLTVNVTGCFVIAFLNVAFLGPWIIRQEYRMAILVGVLGGFTTFSSYGWETVSLFNDGQWFLGVSNFMLNNALGLLAAWLGYRLAQGWLGTMV